jgi:hypothetical protein
MRRSEVRPLSGGELDQMRDFLRRPHNGPQHRRVLLDYPPAKARKGTNSSHLDVQVSLVPRDLAGKCW